MPSLDNLTQSLRRVMEGGEVIYVDDIVLDAYNEALRIFLARTARISTAPLWTMYR